MHIKNDLFRSLEFSLSRKEVKAKLGDAALAQKNGLNVDINQHGELLEFQKKNFKKKKNEQEEKKNQKSSTDEVKNASQPSKENELLKKLNWL